LKETGEILTQHITGRGQTGHSIPHNLIYSGFEVLTAVTTKSMVSSVRLIPASIGFLLGFFIGPENGGNVFLRNVGVSPN
jgi:hypothetical protein